MLGWTASCSRGAGGESAEVVVREIERNIGREGESERGREGGQRVTVKHRVRRRNIESYGYKYKK